MKNSVFNQESVVSFLVVLGLVLPIAQGGFVLSYLYSYFVLFIILLLCSKVKLFLSAGNLVVASAVFVVLAFSSYIDSLDADGYWYLRELIRIPILIVFLFDFKFDRNFLFRRMALFLSVTVILDFFLLYVLSETLLANIIKSAVAMNGMSDFLEAYWRHIGLGGNPNFSSFIYSISIIFLLWGMVEGELEKKYSIFYFCALGIAFFLLLISYSRTSLVATSISILLVYFRIKYIPILLLCAVVAFLGLFYEQSMLDSMYSRFSSFSSFDARIKMWDELFQSYNAFTFLFGAALPVDVVDNDYLYFFYRYGFFVSLIVLSLPIYIGYKLRRDKFFKLYFGVLMFFYIAAFPGGTLTHPKTFFFIIFFVSSFYVKRRTEG